MLTCTLGSAIGPVHMPLNPDVWTNIAIAPNIITLTRTKAMLDASGRAKASFNIPQVNIPSTVGVVYDQKNNFYMASNPARLTLVK